MDFATLESPTVPSAWLDLNALDSNIRQVNQTLINTQVRLATKSIRSIDVIRYIQARTPNFIGLMSYSAEESLYLLENGFDNILCAYPTLDTDSIVKTVEYTQQGAVMVWMADRLEHLAALNNAAKIYKQQTGDDVTLQACLDINMSMPLPALYFGTKRSALKHKSDVKKLLKEAKILEYVDCVGVMGYEAQIAGFAERSPNSALLAPVIRQLKKRSKRQVSQRRQSVVAWLTAKHKPLQLVNGGGSGSMAFTASQSEVTEVTVGSAYYKPAYFDYMDSMQPFKAAAGFVLPVTRQPEKKVITCQGGGFIASGAIGVERMPVVVYPPNLKILKDEGFGEVQTPMTVTHSKVSKLTRDSKHNQKSVHNKESRRSKNTYCKGEVPSIGDAVWCRHAKAGELCEHFNTLICYRDNKVLMHQNSVRTMRTYRGEGQCFH